MAHKTSELLVRRTTLLERVKRSMAFLGVADDPEDVVLSLTRKGRAVCRDRSGIAITLVREGDDLRVFAEE